MVDDGIILRSQANLVAARGADWGAAERETARLILDRIAAQARARAFREVRTRFAGCNDALLAEAKQRFGVVAPFGGPTSSGMLTLHCPPAQVHALASFLREKGAESVTVAELDYVFARDNPLYAKLEAGLNELTRSKRRLARRRRRAGRNTTKCDIEKLTRKLDPDREHLGGPDRHELRREHDRRGVGDRRRRGRSRRKRIVASAAACGRSRPRRS